jgi:hypothetical protein
MGNKYTIRVDANFYVGPAKAVFKKYLFSLFLPFFPSPLLFDIVQWS